MNHRADYHVTFEEFKEAVDGINANLQKRSGLGAAPFSRGLFGWVLFVAVAVMLFMLLNQRKSPPAAAAPPGARPGADLWSVLVPLLPWLLIFGVIWFFVFRYMRRRYLKTWEDTRWIHRPQSMTIDESGLTFTEPTAARRLSWDHFVRFGETENLFLLFSSEYSAEFIPKRIFATAAEADQFRALLARHVSPPTGAFPVVPVVPVAPGSRDGGDAGAGGIA
ncbi:MAG: YcxB-like protein [Humisphaera sp.]|nr:YcxB-like protein [Humisphaera sp.]